MKEQFVPYELAVKLKELRFDENLFYKYYYKGDIKSRIYDAQEIEYFDNKIIAPLWQQAFDWFRENHSLYSIIIPTINMYWTFKTTTVVEGMVEVPPYNHVDANDYSTYEEARQACLEKLIELCK